MERAELKSTLSTLGEEDVDTRMEILDQIRDINENLKNWNQWKQVFAR